MTPRSVLVTGSNRSGTTWVGEMLCHSRQLTYVHEPFNPGIWPRWTAQELPYRNLYVCKENEAPYVEPMRAIIERRRPLLAQVADVRSLRDAGRWTRDAARRAVQQSSRRSTLIKDPIAMFSAPWMADRFDLSVVTMIRNPAAFASSIKRLEWSFDFRNWLDQDLLMRDLLARFERDIIAMVDRPHDLIEQSILLWRVHYDVVDRFRREHPDWLFPRWEDLADSPVERFRDLYAQLGLRFDDRAAGRITNDNAPGNIREVATDDKGTVRRDSRATVRVWRHRLDKRDFDRVRDGVADVVPRFYEPDEWAMDAAS